MDNDLLINFVYLSKSMENSFLAIFATLSKDMEKTDIWPNFATMKKSMQNYYFDHICNPEQNWE